MNIDVINKTNVKVTVNRSEDGTFSILIVDAKANNKPLGKVKPGSVIKIGSREWVVLGHGADTTAVITKEFAVKEMKFDDSSADYAKSSIRKWLNDQFYSELIKEVGEKNVITHTVNLIADDGTGKGNVVHDKISLLTTDLYRRYREYLPAYGDWWWTATPASKEEGYSRNVCYVRGGGALGWDGCVWGYGVRPFCILSSSILDFEEVKS